MQKRPVNKFDFNGSSSELEDEIESEEDDPNRELTIEDIFNP